MTRKIEKTDAEWRELLSPEEYQVTRQKGTERAFTGRYWDCHEAGQYRCTCCGTELFSSEHKFDSGCGWPSFYAASAPENVEEAEDRSHFMVRTEVLCHNCGVHPKPRSQHSDMAGGRMLLGCSLLVKLNED